MSKLANVVKPRFHARNSLQNASVLTLSESEQGVISSKSHLCKLLNLKSFFSWRISDPY